MQLSNKKTGFIASSVEAKRMLQGQLPQGGPVVHDVMRDLGVDCAAGRLRRIMTMRGRRKKAGNKTRKMNTLKIPQRAVRLKLSKGSVQVGVSWGHQAMGLAPQKKVTPQICNGSPNGIATNRERWEHGHCLRHATPAQRPGLFVSQVKVYRQFFQDWPEHLHRDLAKAC